MNKKQAIALLSTSAGILLFAVAVVVFRLMNPAPPAVVEPSSTSQPQVSSESEAPAPPEPEIIRMVAVGDNLIHDTIYNQAAKRAGGDGYDFDFVYQHIAPLIEGADVAFINQETLLATAVAPPASYPRFNSPTQVGDTLIKLGFNVVNHANNHMFDWGEKGYAATIDYWKSKPGVLLTGAYENDEDLHSLKIFQAGDISIAFIGMTERTNGLSLPAGSDMRYISTDETELIEELVTAAKGAADLVVVSAHWGNEDTHNISDYQHEKAQMLADLGVDIIIGTHSHTIQPMEWLERADDGKTLVAYSLGNFVSAQSSPWNMPAGMLDLEITKDYASGTTAVTSAYFVPTVTHFGSGKSDVTIYPLSDYTPELANVHGVRGKYPVFNYKYVVDTVRNNISPEFWSPELEKLMNDNP